MRKLCLLMFFVFGLSFANNNPSTNQNDPKVGDVLVINSTSNSNYNHIDFPRLNTIAKRGKVANYKSVHGKRVVVKDVINNGNGTTRIVIENEDGAKFFGFLSQVEADYNKSLASGELLKVNL